MSWLWKERLLQLMKGNEVHGGLVCAWQIKNKSMVEIELKSSCLEMENGLTITTKFCWFKIF